MSSSAHASFTVTRFRPGYNSGQVDAFVAGMTDRTVQEVNDVVFDTTRLTRGYDQRAVDDYLDACIERKREALPGR